VVLSFLLLAARKLKDHMDEERKKPARGKPARSFGAARPAKGGDGGKKFRKHTPPRRYEKGGEGRLEQRGEAGGDAKPFRKKTFDKPAGAPTDGERRERKPFVKREGSAERPFRKSFSKPGEGERGDRPDRKPFVKREDGGGERPFRKPFEKRAGDDRGPRRDKPFGKPAFGDRQRREHAEGGERPVRRERDGAASRDKRPAFRPRPMGDDRPAPRAEAEGGERIAKRLARAGLASRRDAEALIADGRIRVNGKVLESPAINVTASDRIELDGVEIPAIERTRLFLFNKPAGLVTTNRDPEGRRTVFDVLPEGLPRLMTVGRLDINTEGLLLLTNDGGLSRVMELPATGWLRRYRVRVHGTVKEQDLADLRDGVAVDGVFYGAIEAQLDREQGTNAWLTIGLREGKNREVKNVLGSLGLDVTRLIRISYGPFQLGELPEGHVMEIRGRTLRDQLGERLIEESGANFDADVAMPFPNRPVRRGEPRAVPEAPRRERRENLREGAGGLIKNFRRDRDRKRSDDLGRWSTNRDDSTAKFKRGDDAGKPARKPFGDKPRADGPKPTFGKRPARADREERPIVEPGVRRANVWMAPGARPQGKRPSERAAEKRDGDKRPPRKSGGFRGSRPGGGQPRPRAGGPKGPRSPGKPRGGKS
jgi:23S rRNA pseudouridine2605 synthase